LFAGSPERFVRPVLGQYWNKLIVRRKVRCHKRAVDFFLVGRSLRVRASRRGPHAMQAAQVSQNRRDLGHPANNDLANCIACAGVAHFVWLTGR
jgi:hypothetical protein